MPRYDLEIATISVEMLRRFKLGTKKKWRSMATIYLYDTYQEFYEILLRIANSENMSGNSEKEEGKDSNLNKHKNKSIGKSSQRSR